VINSFTNAISITGWKNIKITIRYSLPYSEPRTISVRKKKKHTHTHTHTHQSPTQSGIIYTKAKRVNTITSAADDGYCQIISETITLERPFKTPRTPNVYSAQFVSTSRCSTGRGIGRRSSSQIQLWPSDCPQTADSATWSYQHLP